MVRKEICDQLEKYQEYVLSHRFDKKQAIKMREEILEFISQNNVTREEIQAYRESGAGEMLYMLSTMPEPENSSYKPVFERMQEQQKFMQVDPESEEFAEELKKKYPDIPDVYKSKRHVSFKDADLSVFYEDNDDPFDDEV